MIVLTSPVQLTDVIYNAATQSFEASVTIYEKSAAYRYPCVIEGPISMRFQDAAKALEKQAFRQHGNPAGLCSVTRQPIPQRQLRHHRLDLRVWLQNLLGNPGNLAT